MKVLLKQKSYFNPKNQEWLTPPPKWVEVDSNWLSDNQYNTVEGERVFDSQILAIKDDARIDKGRCRSCGAIVERGQEEKHYTEQEAKKCDTCSYFRERLINTSISKTTETQQESGEKVKERTITETYKTVCTYNYLNQPIYRECIYKECRKSGVNWFTANNTFFIKYPNGFTQSHNDIKKITFDFEKNYGSSVSTYPKKIGSFTLEAHFTQFNFFEYFRLYNCRESLRFWVELVEDDLNIIVIDSMGYKVKKNFESSQNILTCNSKLKALLIKRLKQEADEVEAVKDEQK